MMRQKHRSLYIILLLFASLTGWAQISVVSWNLQNFGNSKSQSQLQFIAMTVKDFDIVALQEVVAGPGGAQSVARLASELDRMGSDWDYIVSAASSPYNGESERYAFLWKKSVVKHLKAWNDKLYYNQISREPYYATFVYQGKQFTIASFHALPKKKQPETEIKYLKYVAAENMNKNLIFVGDFNLPQSHTVFNPLRTLGWRSAFENQKTTLKMECKNSVCLASEYDNIWMPPGIILRDCGVLHFYETFPDMKAARKISDHVPVYIQFSMR